ncbi:MAG TPA: 6-bladed beta-propeller [bacterium]|nr:6-bladed beta-propeller [bacterium]HPT29591.1 6-bladed beta-propeller [bacterium]
MYTKIAPVLINAEQKNHSVVQLFLAEPTPHEEKWAGTLFALLEIETKKNQAQRVIDFIIGALNSHYYQNEKIALREKIPTLKIENIFETALVKVNQDLLDFLAREKIDLNPRQISATIGIIHENQLHFSNIGKSQALLLNQDDTDRYHLINVEKNEHRPQKYAGETLSFKKLFSSIISGEMPPKSYFLFANEALAEYLFNRELIEIITKLAPTGAAEQIKNTLGKINPYVPFAGLIIKNTVQTETDSVYTYNPNHIQPTVEERTPVAINESETETEKIMAADSPLSPQKISWLGSCLLWPFRLIGKTFNKLFGLFKFKSKDKAAEVLGLENKPLKGMRIPGKKRKTIKIIIILCLLALLVNLGVQKLNLKRQDKSQEAKQYEEQILQKENQIESYLLYNDEKSAQQVLAELKTLINGIPEPIKAKINNYSELLNTYNTQLGKLEHVDTVQAQPEWFNFSGVSPENIIITGNRLLAADSDTKTIYQIDLNSRASSTLNIAEAGNLNNYAVSKNGNAYYGDGQKIWKWANGQISTTTIALTGELSALDTYNNKLYILDKPKSQVYRYALDDQNNWTGGESRLKGSNDFSAVVSWSIDNSTTQGAIYLLKNNGQALKYFDGANQTFSLAAIEPALTQGNKIKVAKNIYVLDSANKRIIVFSKDGKFIKQYQSEQFNSLTDMALDSAEKNIYLLNGPVIYQIKL